MNKQTKVSAAGFVFSKSSYQAGKAYMKSVESTYGKLSELVESVISDCRQYYGKDGTGNRLTQSQVADLLGLPWGKPEERAPHDVQVVRNTCTRINRSLQDAGLVAGSPKAAGGKKKAENAAKAKAADNSAKADKPKADTVDLSDMTVNDIIAFLQSCGLDLHCIEVVGRTANDMIKKRQNNERYG